MPVVVYPRLHELLRARNLSVAELERQIEQRLGLGGICLYCDEPLLVAELLGEEVLP